MNTDLSPTEHLRNDESHVLGLRCAVCQLRVASRET